MKKKWKRITASVLCLALVMTALAFLPACRGRNSDPGEDDTAQDDGIDYNSPKNYIVSDGNSEYRILISDEAQDAEAFAAQELQAFIQESTGANLPIITDDGVPYDEQSKLICVGDNDILRAANLDENYANVTNDSFIIKTVGNLVLIKGGSKRGTLYGAYDFLEKFVGVRFLASDCTYVPDQPAFYIHSLSIREVPAFEQRTYFMQQVMADPLFAARSRLISLYSSNISEYGGGYLQDWGGNNFHNFGELLPQSNYPDHPEWFAEYSGTGELGEEPCLTNGITDNDQLDESMEESVVKEMTKNVISWIEATPHAKYFFVGQVDSASSCRCSRCGQSALRNGGYAGTLMVFINQIARAVEEWRQANCPEREIYIATFAYRWSLQAPVTNDENGALVPVNDNVVPEDNVIIYYAASSSCFYHAISDESCSVNNAARGQLKGWSTIAKHMILYYYGVNFTWHPWYFPNIGSMQDNLRMFRDLGAIQVIDQAAPREYHFYDMLLKNYLYAKLMWDPDQNVTSLVREFNFYYFGGTKNPDGTVAKEGFGKYVDQYHDLMERHYAKLNAESPFHTDIYETDGIFTNAMYFPKGLLEQATGLIETAIAEAQADETLSDKERSDIVVRLTRVLIQPEFMILKNFTAYYDESLQTDYARQWFDHCATAGLVNISEGHTLDWYKEELGLM